MIQERNFDMKKLISWICAATLAVAALSTSAAATEYVVCNHCDTQHALSCGGKDSDESGEKSHRYGLFWVYKCVYTEEDHFSVVSCPQAGTIYGSDHIYSASGHNYDDAGNSVCGGKNGVFGCI